MQATECVDCVVGQYGRGGVEPCAWCLRGSADTDLDPSTECTACLTGFYLAPGATVCAACDEGKVDGDLDPTTPCNASCAPGQYAPPASTSCTTCPAGRSDEDSDASTLCTACPRGHCARAGGTRCASCAATVSGSLDLDGAVPVGVIYTALTDSVGSGASDGSTMRLLRVTQTAVRSVEVSGRTAADFAPPPPETGDEDEDDDDDEPGEDAEAVLEPSPEAEWWREALTRGVSAATQLAITESAGSDDAVLSAVRQPSPAITVEIVGVESARRRLQGSAAPAAVVSYAISVSASDVATGDASEGLAGLVRALDAGATATFTAQLAAGFNVALELEHIDAATFIAGVALQPLSNGSVAEAPTPVAVTAAHPSFQSVVEYEALSFGSADALVSRLTVARVVDALAATATAAGWPAPSLSGLEVVPPPAPPPPPPEEGIGAGLVLVAVLGGLCCCVLAYREQQRRRLRKQHRVYVQSEKAKDDAVREAEDKSERARLEEEARLEREAEEAEAMAHAARVAEEELERVMRARNIKEHERREREERWEEDKRRVQREREEELQRAREEQKREKEKMRARLEAMAARRGIDASNRVVQAAGRFDVDRPPSLGSSPPSARRQPREP
eukprot:COSAG04_NODE_139_length_23663_cov_6.466893_9_plen_620_part_00